MGYGCQIKSNMKPSENVMIHFSFSITPNGAHTKIGLELFVYVLQIDK